jgi:hypothetical protein
MRLGSIVEEPLRSYRFKHVRITKENPASASLCGRLTTSDQRAVGQARQEESGAWTIERTPLISGVSIKFVPKSGTETRAR